MRQYEIHMRDGSVMAFTAARTEVNDRLTQFLNAEGVAVAVVATDELLEVRFHPAG